MPRVLLSAATLLLLAQAVPAAQGTHPGPLPSPIDSDRGTGAPPAAEAPPYPETRSFGTSRAFGSPGAPRGAGDDRLDWGGGQGWAGYPPAAPGGAYGPGDHGYGTAPGKGHSYGAPRGYWQWVPAEPAEPEGYGQGTWPDYGYGRDHVPYAPYGYTPPYDGYGYGDGYRDTYPGEGFGPPGYGQAAPGFGQYPPYEVDGYYPSPGYYPEPPGGAADAGPSHPVPKASDPSRGSTTGSP